MTNEPDLSHGITRDEHDEWVEQHGRPVTQSPVRKRRIEPDEVAEVRTVIDELIDRLEQERNG